MVDVDDLERWLETLRKADDLGRWFIGSRSLSEETEVWLSTVDGSGDRKAYTLDPGQSIRLDALVEDAEDY